MTDAANPCPVTGVFARLARDRGGNTLAMIAAAIAPLMAMVGGAVDMSRSYLAQARLQQACDAGVLAARKRMGSQAAVTGEVPQATGEIGQRFFNVNFRDGAYGSTERRFTMSLEDDFGISGAASIKLPTTIMRLFGFEELPIAVACSAQINFSNTDVMMVLDTTGSMAQTNPGDSASRISVLRSTVRDFYAQLAAASGPGTRIRYGFVPYSTNVNVGSLLDDSWVVNQWTYQSRTLATTLTSTGTTTYNANWQTISGTVTSEPYQTYPATYRAPTSETGSASYSCDTPAPASTATTTTTLISTTTEPFAGPPAGTRTIRHYRQIIDGVSYSISRSGTTCRITKSTYAALTREYDQITDPVNHTSSQWLYQPVTLDVTNWRNDAAGCMEERDTYPITNYEDVDLSRALDLDIDLVPTATDPRTQWRPMYPGIVYARAMRWNGTGSFSKAPVTTTEDYVNPGAGGFAACPARARKLGTMTAAQVDSYLNTLTPAGNTYHDIGMIWGGRLLSPSGLFAEENGDVDPGRPTARHMIFLTDGVTDALDLSYGTYGVEPLDARRWDGTQPQSLNQTVENRFAVACAEVKKRNITVWIVGFGTSLNPVMRSCAGEGRYFEANNADELTATFATIVKNLSKLRIER
ncbi:Tad domain-containing protein [Altererythrobacter sp. TH136]|uniref:TadE/TadG family type IV pilus assembly protein n=1 Tax=Altererythrobacter sp. TH136 TaxID=2067415 RepID=UPI001163A741|nr:Tad domain-containing protein [Altererythrobacter sp. TH136]QDM39939.1 hypothetical protein C0V74_01890 [Altererythrobacter sp. TH136]